LNSKKILVTGASGYLGERIAGHLSVLGYNVIPAFGSRIPDWGKELSVGWRSLDVTDPTSCTAAIEGCDTVIHLAAINEWECIRNPRRAFEINTIGTLNVLEAAKAAKTSRFIYFSTAHVYGPLVGQISESTVPQPVHPYAYTHHAAEDIVRSFAQGAAMATVSVRLSNAFGAPRSPEVNRWSLLVNDVCRQVILKKVIELSSPGLQLRDFVGISDVVRAVEHLLTVPGSLLVGQPINLGGNNIKSVFAMAQLIQQRSEVILGLKPDIRRPDPTIGEVAVPFHFDSSRMAEMGFKWLGHETKEIDDTLRFCLAASGSWS
jgi:UDP-glucose 4-epimerase